LADKSSGVGTLLGGRGSVRSADDSTDKDGGVTVLLLLVFSDDVEAESPSRRDLAISASSEACKTSSGETG